MDQLVARPVSPEQVGLAEGCRWDEQTQTLLWVDVFTGRLMQSTYDGEQLAPAAVLKVEGHLTAIAPLRDRDRGWFVAVNQGVGFLGRDGALSVVAEPEAVHEGRVRTNDAACDPAGRFWVGSMAYDVTPGAGSLYRVEDGRCERVWGDLTISNGLGWSPDGTRMYHVDSGAGTISVADYDVASGVPSNRRPLVVLEPDDGLPDGLCVDAAGDIWVAVWGGGQVRRYSSDGELRATVSVAAIQPSCCTLGGPDRRTLFITTAREGLTPEALATQPDAGRLFAVEVETPGLALAAYGAVPGSGPAREARSIT
jgi:sugar lactone lactonase YvrE